MNGLEWIRLTSISRFALATAICFLTSAGIAQTLENPRNPKQAKVDPADNPAGRAQQIRDARKENVDTELDEAEESAESAIEDARETAIEAGERAKEAAEAARQRANLALDKARSSAHEAVDQARDRTGAGGTRSALSWQQLRAPDIGIWFDRSVKNGLVIADVSTTGIIADTDLRAGDWVVSVNDQKVATERQFLEQLFAEPDSKSPVAIVVERNKSRKTIEVNPVLLFDEVRTFENDPLTHLGITVDDRSGNRILVWRIEPRSPAFYAGLRAGDVITSFDGQRLATIRDLIQAIRSGEAGNVAVQVERKDQTRDFEVELPQFFARIDREEWLRNREARRDERRENREERVDRRQDRRADRNAEIDAEANSATPAEPEERASDRPTDSNRTAQPAPTAGTRSSR